MNWPNFILASLVGCISWNSCSALAQPQARVGEASVVKNQVFRVSGSGGQPINVGDAVLRNETVRTGADSATRLVMIDSTNLALGANSSITLDKTVFNDDHSYRDVTIRLTTGAFRFVTGHSDKNAYKITTPLATIGVRGTTLDILSQRGRSVVVLQDGASRVCTTNFRCLDLTHPGDTAVISVFDGKTSIKKANVPPWTFAANCAATAGLCSTTQYASQTIPRTALDDATAMLCGR